MNLVKMNLCKYDANPQTLKKGEMILFISTSLHIFIIYATKNVCEIISVHQPGQFKDTFDLVIFLFSLSEHKRQIIAAQDSPRPQAI